MKGQSGVEYLAVYAIAFMIVLVVLAGVYYMWARGRVINPYCEFSVDFVCVDYSLKENGGLTLMLRQSTGRTINITAFNCTSAENENLIMRPINVQLNDGEQKVVVANEPCYRASGEIAAGSSGSLYNGKIFIKYVETDTLFEHLIVGRITAKYE